MQKTEKGFAMNWAGMILVAAMVTGVVVVFFKGMDRTWMLKR
jgi:hypothetical protein